MEKQVVVYSRISKGQDINNTIKREKEIIKNYAKESNVKVVDTYRDIYKSTLDERTEYNRLITDIFEGKVNYIIVCGGADRLTRDINTLKKILENVEVNFITTKRKEITAKDIKTVNLWDYLEESFGINLKGGDNK